MTMKAVRMQAPAQELQAAGAKHVLEMPSREMHSTQRNLRTPESLWPCCVSYTW